MPLLALVDDDRVVSTLLDDDAWVALQGDVKAGRRTVRMQPCGLPGHLRTSKRGLRHFAHNAGGGDCGEHTGESPLHLAAKAEILLGAVDAGWTAEPEHRGDGWVADVLALREQVRVAFEVQVSQQVESDYRRRQDRYEASGVRCAWVVKHAASVPGPRKDLPIFLLSEGEEGALTVRVGEQDLPLRAVAAALLSRRIAFREYVAGPEPGATDVRLYEMDGCYKCGRDFLVWEVEGTKVVGACGLIEYAPPDGDDGLFSSRRPENTPPVWQAVRAGATGLPQALATIQMRNTQMSGTRYEAFCCPHCGATCGDFFIRQEILNQAYDQPLLMLSVPGVVRGLPRPHWCVDSGAGHCLVPPGG